MTRQLVELRIADVSQFARALRRALEISAGHQSTLNAIARAAGYRNFQHLKAEADGPETEPVDRRAVDRALAWFDERGRLSGWPGRHKIQTLCMWALWSQLPDRAPLTEREISDRIDALALFRDAAQVRRALIDSGLMRRCADGSEYRRVGRRPGATERAVVAAVAARARSRAGSGERPRA